MREVNKEKVYVTKKEGFWNMVNWNSSVSCISLVMIESVDYISRVWMEQRGVGEKEEIKWSMSVSSSKSVVVVVVYVEFCYMPPLVYMEHGISHEPLLNDLLRAVDSKRERMWECMM